MSVEDWERHNEGFRFEPPEGPPELWDQDDYDRVYDRVISRHVRWECDKCTKPFSSLKNARSHVQNQHSERLIDQAVSRQDGSEP